MIKKLIIIILIIIFINTVFFNKLYITHNTTNITFKRCSNKPVTGIVKKIFSANNIIKNNNQWTFYFPCGYNQIEKQLVDLKPDNQQQLVYGISGCDKIVAKNSIWVLLRKQYGHHVSKQIMPETFILTNINDMKYFHQLYTPTDTYILK
jgi:hypothetical protein